MFQFCVCMYLLSLFHSLTARSRLSKESSYAGDTGSFSGSWNSDRYGCERPFFAVSLTSGSKTSMPSNRSMAVDGTHIKSKLNYGERCHRWETLSRQTLILALRSLVNQSAIIVLQRLMQQSTTRGRLLLIQKHTHEFKRIKAVKLIITWFKMFINVKSIWQVWTYLQDPYQKRPL